MMVEDIDALRLILVVLVVSSKRGLHSQTQLYMGCEGKGEVWNFLQLCVHYIPLLIPLKIYRIV